MRSIFIYEFLTAGGCWSLGNEPPAGSLLAEGRAMRDALAIDAAAISADVEVHLFHDARLPDPELPQQRLHRIEDHIDLGFRFGEMLESIDAAILIAPEFSRQMLSLIETWEIFSAKTLFSPGSATIQLCGDKQQTCDHL